jgi:hypothetical protein
MVNVSARMGSREMRRVNVRKKPAPMDTMSRREFAALVI